MGSAFESHRLLLSLDNLLVMWAFSLKIVSLSYSKILMRLKKHLELYQARQVSNYFDLVGKVRSFILSFH